MYCFTHTGGASTVPLVYGQALHSKQCVRVHCSFSPGSHTHAHISSKHFPSTHTHAQLQGVLYSCSSLCRTAPSVHVECTQSTDAHTHTVILTETHTHTHTHTHTQVINQTVISTNSPFLPLPHTHADTHSQKPRLVVNGGLWERLARGHMRSPCVWEARSREVTRFTSPTRDGHHLTRTHTHAHTHTHTHSYRGWGGCTDSISHR